MKKFLLLTLVCLSCVASYAAQLTATLQSGDNMTPFYGDNSFVEAYEAAVDGDVITLSPGQFNGVTSIVKSIKVIGSYAFDEKASTATILSNNLTIEASNVSFEGVRFTNTNNNGITIKATDQLTFSRCYIYRLNNTKGDSVTYHTNTRLLDCQVLVFGAMSLSDNLVLQNCCISYFSEVNDKSKLAYIENCQIRYWYVYLNNGYKQPYAVYNGCFLGCFSGAGQQETLTLSSPSEFHKSIIFKLHKYPLNIDSSSCVVSALEQDDRSGSNLSAMPDLSFTPYTYKNVSYGPIDHKAYPAIPVIASSLIDSKTDAVGNLHIKIEAEVRD